jgi:hypothetical protein
VFRGSSLASISKSAVIHSNSGLVQLWIMRRLDSIGWRSFPTPRRINPNSFYILLGDCQDIVGHWQQDFDTGTYMSYICFYVTVVPLLLYALYPKSILPLSNATCVTSCHITSLLEATASATTDKHRALALVFLPGEFAKLQFASH